MILSQREWCWWMKGDENVIPVYLTRTLAIVEIFFPPSLCQIQNPINLNEGSDLR